MIITKIKHSFNDFCLDIENLKLQKGTIVGLVGANGAGKTTFMNILSGYLEANIKNIVSKEDIKKEILIPDTIDTYDYLTVEELIMLSIKYSSTNAKVDEVLSVLDLLDKRNVVIEALSAGMQKKLTLLPLFITDYDLIILDEPFNSIDLQYIFKLKKLLKEKKDKAIIIISSHILETLTDLADKIILLDNGRIVKELNEPMSIKELEREIFNGGN